MEFTTKSARRLDRDKLQALIDEGWNWISTKMHEEPGEIVSVHDSFTAARFPGRPYPTPIRTSAITAVHQPIPSDPPMVTIDLPKDHWIPASTVEEMMEKLDREGL